VKSCHACGAAWEECREPGRNETCLICGVDMYCCLNCRMYDPIKAQSCTSSTADHPTNKVAANSCEEFEMADRRNAGPSPDERKRALEEKWNRLFKR